MKKEERIKLRKTLLYIADCMIAVDEMEEMNNCNNCGIKRKCAYAPELGTPVRWNCPLWRMNGGVENDGGKDDRQKQDAR